MAEFLAQPDPKAPPPGRIAYVNARLLDPASGLDAPGALLTDGRRIVEMGPGLFADGVPEGTDTVDCGGHCLAPGLVDMHVHLREPGHEHKETLATGSALPAASPADSCNSPSSERTATVWELRCGVIRNVPSACQASGRRPCCWA